MQQLETHACTFSTNHRCNKRFIAFFYVRRSQCYVNKTEPYSESKTTGLEYRHVAEIQKALRDVQRVVTAASVGGTVEASTE